MRALRSPRPTLTARTDWRSNYHRPLIDARCYCAVRETWGRFLLLKLPSIRLKHSWTRIACDSISTSSWREFEMGYRYSALRRPQYRIDRFLPRTSHQTGRHGLDA